MGWLQLRLVAAADRIEALEDALLDTGALSVTLGDHHDTPILEPGVGETPLWPVVELSALFDENADPAEVSTALTGATGGDTATTVHWEHIADRAWEREWLQHFRPLCFGEHFWVCPSSMAVSDPSATVLHLDPGLAFGTGTHPSTALCLQWLADNPPVNARVIDYGCGSGILGIAAVLLGASHVQAVDIDEQALLATRDNATRNALPHGSLEACSPDQLGRSEPADLLLANILAGPLIELAPRLARLLRPGATAVLSGVLHEQAAQVRAAWAPWFDHISTLEHETWCRIELQRSPDAALRAR